MNVTVTLTKPSPPDGSLTRTFSADVVVWVIDHVGAYHVYVAELPNVGVPRHLRRVATLAGDTVRLVDVDPDTATATNVSAALTAALHTAQSEANKLHH